MRTEKFDPDLLCPLCGVEQAQHDGSNYIEREHIPPRSIFVDASDPSGLITVPSCRGCNSTNSQLDEEFKVNLAIHVAGHLEAPRPFLQKAFDTTRKNKRLYDVVDTGLSPAPALTESGRLHEVVLNWDPVEKGVTKISRGLHWLITGEVLDKNTAPEIVPILQGKSIDPQTAEIFAEFGKIIQKCGNQFEAVWVVPQDAAHGSSWLLRFHGQDCFIVAFRPWINSSQPSTPPPPVPASS